MNLSEVKQDKEWICYKTSSFQEAYAAKVGFTPGRYTLEPEKKRRSKNANAYAWELMGRIASKTGTNVVDVYRNEIREIPGKSFLAWVSSEDVKGLKESWLFNHLGRDCYVIEDDGAEAQLLFVYGSSDYDTKQMSQLIENIIQDCQALGIETKNPNDISSLLEQWEKRTTNA